MKLLFLLQGEAEADQIGAVDALAKLRAAGVVTECEIIPYLRFGREHGWAAFADHVQATARRQASDVVFFQFFHGPMTVKREAIVALRQLPSRPTVVVSCGDPFGRWFNPPPPALRTVSAVADLTFLTGMGHLADSLVSSGSQNVLLMTNGHCQVRFPPVTAAPGEPEFDVVFIGSRLQARNFLSDHWRAAHRREQMVRALEQRYGKRFGLFGHNWERRRSWQGTVPYNQQCAVYRRARIGVGGYPHSRADYYTSDRVFMATASGTPFVDQYVPRVDRLLRNNEHWFLYHDQADMLRRCDQLLALGDEERRTLGRRTAEYCAARHTQYHRNREMLLITQAYRQAILAGQPPARPQFEFFLPEVDQAAEWPFAARRWGALVATA